MFFSRGKNKVQNCYTIQDMYKVYIKDMDERDPRYVSYNTYKTILCAYFKNIAEVLYDQSLNYKIPNNFGTFQIVKKPRNFKHCSSSATQIDWKNTVKYGKKIFYVNEHSEGYRFLFMWDKRGIIRNISKYRFIPTRTNKRKLAYYVKNKIKDYFEVK